MNVSYLNMAHALSSDQAPFNRRLESCKQVSGLRGQGYRRVQEILVGVGMRQVSELGAQGRDLQVDVVVPIDERLD